MSLTYNNNQESIFSEYTSLLIDCNNTTQLNETIIVIPIILIQQSYNINNNNNYLVKPYIRKSPNSPIGHAPITAHVASISQINKRSSINYIMFLFWICIYLFSVYIGYYI
jgi:hypothetical protein